MFATAIVFGAARSASSVDFAQDVRPILARNCFTCHGPDEQARQADLRLDTVASATADLGGYRAITPGDASQSELIERVTSTDADLRMPPSDAHPPLSPDEIELLRDWIDQGAGYETHWAFRPPTPPEIPAVIDVDWCRSPIDRFVLRQLEANRLTPAPEADRVTLIRRLYLDLLGFPPPPAAVHSFSSDPDPLAYERLVEGCLSSPAYAERFARPWLDLARYADTNGYEKDRPRTIWPYRDWVIHSLATDMPFDQFSVTQLAGDLLPNADRDQHIATGFHRNTMLNEEGGIDPLEYRYYAVVDRVATTGTVWLGMTIGCAQCHTHKYDPITHTDYYRLFALLNQTDEPELELDFAGIDRRRRTIAAEIDQAEWSLARDRLPNYSQYRQNADPAAASDPLQIAFLEFVAAQRYRRPDWQALTPRRLGSTMPLLMVLADDSILASGDVTKRDVYTIEFELAARTAPITAIQLEALPHESLPAGGPGLAYYEGRRGDFFLSELKARFQDANVELEAASHSYGNISVGSGSADASNVLDGQGSTGWSTSGAEGLAHQLVVNLSEPIRGPGRLEIELLFERHFAAALGRFRISVTTADATVTASPLAAGLDARLARLVEEGEPIDPTTYRDLQRHFVRTAAELAELREPIDQLREMLPERVRTLVMEPRADAHQRSTRRHHRGEYLQPRELVEPGIPELFQRSEESPGDRLELARWLVSPDNPLVGRVTVNRAWREFFGTGLVRTAGDFGTQSEPPSHPALLDWLAIDWVRNGWSMKRLHRQLVTSSTYRQALAAAPPDDPDHRLLSAMPHRRLDAEQIRDSLLAAAGLLTHQVGGPSVYPPQPDAVMELAYGNPAWQTSIGADRFRRSLYTFSKRTAPFAAFTTFDGPSGELCVARRDRSTTPLQALTLMNDAMYVELARGIATAALSTVGEDAAPEQVIREIYRRLLSRKPQPSEQEAVLKFYHRRTAPINASRQQLVERWMLVARAIMNTDEAITLP